MTIKAKDIISNRLFTISPEASISQALAVFKEKRIRHIAVANEFNLIVGVLSHRDIMNINVPELTTVASCMSFPVEHINQKESLRPVIYKMLEMKISSLIVVDDDKSATGIVTTDDLLWCFAQSLDEKTDNKTMISAKSLQVIGDVVNKLSLVGI